MIADFRHHSTKTSLVILFVAASFFLILFPVPSIVAQTKVTSALLKPDTTETHQAVIDSLGIRAGNISLATERNAKSGSLAMLLSAILPGAGQVYSHRYYTIPLIWGFGAYFTSIALKADGKYLDYQKRFAESVLLDTVKHTGDAYMLSTRDFYRNQRDEYFVYLALTYFLNIIDAYVGATLYNFDISDDLGGSAAIRFKIPLH
jgi:hypothetical protein